FGSPSDKLKMIGVTGTKGKTSTTYMIKSIAEAFSKKVGLIGTIVDMIGEREIYTEKTTPESLDLQRLLRQMLDEGVEWVVMEVSSHSLELKRVAGITYDVGIYTNLAHEHLDFHGDMVNYRAAKRKLFDAAKLAIINADDAAGSFMAQGVSCPVVFYGINNHDGYYAADIKNTPQGVSYRMVFPGGTLDISVGIPGIFMVYNSLAACAAMHAIGVPGECIARGIAGLKGIPGRFEVIAGGGRGYTVIRDYAHTPDSLEQTIKTAKAFAGGRVVTLFGCGGDRDRAKRPMMGEIAGRLSDFVIITSDNPRTEEPGSIIAMIEEGIKRTSCPYICIENRKEAMLYSLKNAMPKDLILFAGKGHETYQEIHGIRYPFDEKGVTAELLKQLNK
ncbi:MAG: UDP-N-acetylmuramoyl-L-alanyl-D-glutamate--2,6-diaminopimelate ligase, partial [Bacillota bacterium]|nr:UDP-N-acetylmuramoyl-L-alanyl-D-glutamate--2,6-diaminopimelate ligase [Bacillota bacterium]